MKEPAVRTTALLLDDSDSPDLGVADAFFALLDQGVEPAIVLRTRAGDENHLAARGTRDVVGPPHRS